jgi:hypothetical protein
MKDPDESSEDEPSDEDAERRVEYAETPPDQVNEVNEVNEVYMQKHHLTAPFSFEQRWASEGGRLNQV